MLHPLPLSTLFPYTTLFRSRPETSAMHLVTDNVLFFEFVPFDPQFIDSDGSVVQDAPVKRFSEVEEGEEYILLISTVSGLWRYMIGDTILFTDIDRAEIKITGRTKFFMNEIGRASCRERVEMTVGGGTLE